MGLATRAFLWSLATVSAGVQSRLHTLPPYLLLPLALPVCVWLIRRFAPAARGHGTEAVIASVHQDWGRIDWKVAPVKLLATVITLAFGGSVGKEGPCAQIGAAITSAAADLLHLSRDDRRRLVICGIAAGFAAVFGTPVSGALFGIEVLYLGRIEYAVLFPSLMAAVVAHLTCGVAPPVPAVHATLGELGRPALVALAIVFGVVFGLAALLLIETMQAVERALGRWRDHPYLVASAGGTFLAVFFSVFGDRYAGLGTSTIAGALQGTVEVGVAAFLLKIVATSATLEAGGSGGIVTPIFFIGSVAGAALARLAGLPPGAFAAFGFVSVLAAAANTPIAAAVMGIELLPGPIGVFAALSAGTAFLIVGHRSVYPSQKVGFSKSAGLDLTLDVPVGEIDFTRVRIREGSLTDRVHRLRLGRWRKDD